MRCTIGNSPIFVPPSSTDNHLLNRAQLESQNSWNILVQKYAPSIYRYARHSGLRPEDAADVTQNVLFQLSKSLRHFDRRTTGSFRRWLKIVTVNKVNDYLRRRRHRDNMDVVYAARSKPGLSLEQESSQQDLPQRTDQEAELQFILEQVKAEVSEATWEAFRMMISGTWSSAEIGNKLGISPDSVRMSKKRVLDKIQAYWKAAGENRP